MARWLTSAEADGFAWLEFTPDDFDAADMVDWFDDAITGVFVRVPNLHDTPEHGAAARAPCGHAGEVVIGNYIRCLAGCEGSGRAGRQTQPVSTSGSRCYADGSCHRYRSNDGVCGEFLARNGRDICCANCGAVVRQITKGKNTP